jgi:hypothetical protein
MVILAFLERSYKIVFESIKCVLSKYEIFMGKGYDYGDLFHLSLHDDRVIML